MTDDQAKLFIKTLDMLRANKTIIVGKNLVGILNKQKTNFVFRESDLINPNSVIIPKHMDCPITGKEINPMKLPQAVIDFCDIQSGSRMAFCDAQDDDNIVVKDLSKMKF